MRTDIFSSIVLSGWVVLAMAGCTREATDIPVEEAQIAFSAAATWQNEEATRTEYSGVFNTVSGNTYERIDWVPGTDRIRIYCNQASVAGSQAKFSDYTVTAPVTAASEKSVAQITPVAANSLRWGSGMHYFYALYPAPGTAWKYDGAQVVSSTDASISGSGNNATITGTVPAAQVVKWNESQKEYEPDMNYAYMYAAASTDAWTPVSLSFKPLVTSLQFTIKAADANVAGKTLSGFRLKSASTNLNGPFSAALTPTACTITDTGTGSGDARKEVHVVIAQGDQKQLSQSDYFKVTLFTLAATTLNNLSIELSFTDGTIRKLELKARNTSTNAYEYITVAPCRKAYINSLSVPDNALEYVLGSLNNVSIGYDGGSGNIATGFTSCMTNGNTSRAVPYTVEYNYDGSWVNNPPAWLSVSGLNTNGNTSGQTITASISTRAELTNDSHHTELASSSRARGTASAPFDLSRYNVAGRTWSDAKNDQSTNQNTANCYVVGGSGYYKFPLVYGNGIKNGGTNQSAYRGHDGTDWRTSSAPYLGYFRDHSDSDITQPYINVAYTGLSADLIWTDEPGLIRNVSAAGAGSSAYISFEVPQEYITQGNALLAVKKGNVIVWSWHIWVTDADLTQCKQGPVCTHTGSQYYIAPQNVGWCDGHANNRSYQQRTCQIRVTQTVTGYSRTATITQTAGTETNAARKGNCPYYQWGRKDPLKASDGQPVNSWASSAKTYYGTQYAQIDSESTIGGAIQNPTTHYSPAGSAQWYEDNWCSTDWLNLWSSTLNATGYGSSGAYGDNWPLRGNDSAKTKTVYDPSPVGFRVPSIDVWCELGPGNSPWSTYGRLYDNKLFFPAAGQRAASDGGVGYIGYKGFYWAANAYESGGSSGEYCGYCLYFNEPYYDSSGYLNDYVYTWNPTYSAQRFANGFPVRPVKE